MLRRFVVLRPKSLHRCASTLAPEAQPDPRTSRLLSTLGLSPNAMLIMRAYECKTVGDFANLSAAKLAVFNETFPSDYSILQLDIVAKPLDVDPFLNLHVNNCDSAAAMRLIERDATLSACAAVLDAASAGTASGKRRIAFLYAMRGSGKTQLVKNLAGVAMCKHLERGRVIVQCLERAMLSGWLAAYRTERSGEQAAMVGLIASHVREVTGVTIVAETVEQAYAQWRAETKRHFGLTDAEDTALAPVIMLDTCEVLAREHHRHLVHQEAPFAGAPLTLLEALALTIPPAHAMLLVGCSASLAQTRFILTAAHVVDIGSLAPLSLEGSIEASKVWKGGAWAKDVPRRMHEVVHSLSGGIPRVHEHAFFPALTMSFATSTLAIPRLLEEWTRSCANFYADVVRDPDSYFVALAAAVRWVAGADACVPMPAGRAKLTFAMAIQRSMCGRSVGDQDVTTYVVAPVLLKTQAWAKLEGTLRATHPVLPELRNLFPILEADVAARCVRNDATQRGAPFERVAVHAMYARYLLASWSLGCPWVPLTLVLGTKAAALADVEVNLEKGVVEPTGSGWTYKQAAADGACQLRWNHKVPSAHHDAYLWARRGTDCEGMPMAVQCRHGQAKTEEELAGQVQRERGGKEPLGLPLLLCYAGPAEVGEKLASSVVTVDISAIAAASAALWLLTPGSLQ